MDNMPKTTLDKNNTTTTTTSTTTPPRPEERRRYSVASTDLRNHSTLVAMLEKHDASSEAHNNNNNNNALEMKDMSSSSGKNLDNNNIRYKSNNTKKKPKTCCQRVGSFLLSLRVRTIVILLVLIAIMLAIFLAILVSVFTTSFNNLELRTTKDATKRVSRAIFDDLDKQFGRLLNYAVWTDTANLMTNFSEAYWEEYRYGSYRKDYMQSAQETNWALFYHLNGSLLVSVGYDWEKEGEEELEVPEELLFLNETHPLRVNMTDIEHKAGGYMTVNFKNETLVLLVTASPITADTDDPESLGILVYATIERVRYVQSIAIRSQLCLTMYTMNDLYKPGIKKYARKALHTEPTRIDPSDSMWENDDPFAIEPLQTGNKRVMEGRQCWKQVGGQRMSTFQVFDDIFGQNAIIMRADVNRYVSQLGYKSFFISYGMIALGCIIIAIVIIAFIERAVLYPIVNLSHGVSEIAENNDSDGRVPILARGEIGSLTRHINEMLDSLDESQRRIREEHEKLQALLTKVSVEEQKARTIMNGIPDFILTVNKSTGVIINANNAFHTKLRYPPIEVENKLAISQIFKKMTHNDMLVNLQQLSDQEQSIETSLFSKFDIEIPVQMSVSSIKLFLNDQLVEAFVVMSKNMSEHHELKETLNAHEEKLKNLTNQIEFDVMLRTPFYKKTFKEFCKKEMSEENMLFIEAVEHYRSMSKTHERALKQQEIIDTFLKVEGAYPLNLSHTVLQRELFLIEKGCGQYDLFDQLESVVRVMVMSDTFARFTKECKKDAPKKIQDTQTPSNNLTEQS